MDCGRHVDSIAYKMKVHGQIFLSIIIIIIIIIIIPISKYFHITTKQNDFKNILREVQRYGRLWRIQYKTWPLDIWCDGKKNAGQNEVIIDSQAYS